MTYHDLRLEKIVSLLFIYTVGVMELESTKHIERMSNYIENFTQKIILSRRFSPYDMYDELEDKFKANGYRKKAGNIDIILLISLNAIGDNVLYSSLVRELRRNNPHCYLVILTTPLVYQLWELCPYVNKLLKLPFDVNEPFEAYFKKISDFCCRELLPYRFAMSICLQWSDDKRPMNLLAYLSGARQRIGISDESIKKYDENFSLIAQWEFLLTLPVVTPVEIVHEAGRALYVLEAMGMKVQNKKNELWLSDTDVHNAMMMLKDSFDYIVLGVGAGAANRKYPIEKWLVVIKDIYNKYQMPFVICGGDNEAQDGEYLQTRLPENSIINLAGKTSLRETAALIAEAYCYLGNGTGTMHMAAALGTPLITLYREAKRRAPVSKGAGKVLSEIIRFEPWMARSVILQPDIAIGRCLHIPAYGGCSENYSHCIAQIRPQEIIQAFDYVVEHFR